jgi:hypothetical protein
MLMRYKQERAHALGLQRYKHIIVVDLSVGVSRFSDRRVSAWAFFPDIPVPRSRFIFSLTLTIKQVMDVSANYFPESAWKIFLVNSPFVFRVSPFLIPCLFKAAWAVVKPWIHPITAAKINIFGSVKVLAFFLYFTSLQDAVKKMAELGIPASSIPKWGGGTHDGLPIIDLLLKEISQSTHMMRCSYVGDEALGKKLEQAADLHSV